MCVCGRMSHSLLQEAGRNLLHLCSQWEATAWGGGPSRKWLGGCGFQTMPDLLSTMIFSSLPFYLFSSFFHCSSPSVFWRHQSHSANYSGLARSCAHPSSLHTAKKYGGLLSCGATVMSAYMAAPSVRKKSFARPSKMCIREQRDDM